MKRILFLIPFVFIALTCSKEDLPTVGYGNKIEVQTQDITQNGLTTISIKATVNSDLPESIIEKGFCWNTTQNATINDNSLKISVSGTFNTTISGLLPGTNYSIRAYVKTTADLIYGNEVKFKTLTLPTLSTASASSITTTTAISGGNISADGGATITARGVCWNTTGSPTVANSRTQDGAGSGAFTSALSGLTPGTVYFVRAYAANSAGTAYGPEITFTTQAPEICTITSITNGTVYSMQAPATGTIVNAGSLYKITMASPIFSFGQASEVAIFRNETKVFSFGTFLLFNETPGNARTFTIPAGLVSSSCYTIRVTKPEGTITAVYVSPRFEIR